MKNTLLIIAVLFASFSSIFSQDIIELKSGEVLEVNITKIGLEDIEFRPYGLDNTAVIKLSKYLIKSHSFEDQNSLVAKAAEKYTNLTAEDLYDKEYKNIYKSNPLLGVLSGSYKVALERSLNYQNSVEFEVGLKNRAYSYGGAGNDSKTYMNASLRYKTYFRPSSVKATDYGKNAMQGFYFAPVATVGSSSTQSLSFTQDSQPINSTNVFAGILIDLGYQVVADGFAIDLFMGAGLVANSENDDFSTNQTHVSTGALAFRTGARIGLNTK